MLQIMGDDTPVNSQGQPDLWSTVKDMCVVLVIIKVQIMQDDKYFNKVSMIYGALPRKMCVALVK
jgi:hypothetical protein